MKKFFIFFFLFCLYFNYLQAQKSILGTINDEKGNPVTEVIVKIKNSEIRTVSNSSGVFMIDVLDTNAVLCLLKAGFLYKEVVATDEKMRIFLSHETADLFKIPLSELLQMRDSLNEFTDFTVVSASNAEEKYSQVPATMIVLTQNDFNERGYQNLTEMLNDLPGMDLAFIHGQMGINNYWRGYRASFSAPYLFMIDGMAQNETYYNHVAILRSVPLSNIDKVEIVYGPVSSVYGSNAFMGVINIVTKKKTEEGLNALINLTGDIKGSFITDAAAIFQKNKFSFLISARLERADLSNFINFDSYEYSSGRYSMDSSLWGSSWTKIIFPKNQFQSNFQYQNINFRFNYQSSEIGFRLDTKYDVYGHADATDKVMQNLPLWVSTYDFWLRQNFILSKNFTSQTLFLHRLEDTPEGSWLEGYNVQNNSSETKEIAGETVAPGGILRVIDYSNWPSLHKTYSLLQTFDVKASEKLTFNAGIKYEIKYITKQKGYYGNVYSPNNINASGDDLFPKNTETFDAPDNIFTWVNYSAYCQTKFAFDDKHGINAGIRTDNNSQYGTNTTFRGGYVGKFGKIVGKLLYGQAYQIPTPRTLYSTYSNFGASSSLKPENSQTIEVQISYTKKNISSYLSLYYVDNQNTIVSVSGTAQNLGQRDIIGADIHANAIIDVPLLKKLQIWGYYSTYFKADEQVFDAQGLVTGRKKIGDLSFHKIYFGATALYGKHLLLNLRARYISERETVASNPLGKVSGYFLADANFSYRNFLVSGFDISLKINNLFNTTYFHPGIGVANAGNTAGKWENGVWQGSSGWQNSLLPQAHRYFLLTLTLSI